MITENKLKKIIQRVILLEMPQRIYKQLPALDADFAIKKGLSPVSLQKGRVYKERSPQEFEKLLNNPKLDSGLGYEKSLAKTFANLDINVDVIVQPIDNSLILYFEDMYTEFSGGDLTSDRIFIIPPDEYFNYVSPETSQSDIGPDFPVFFKNIHKMITNWCNSDKLNDGNSCLFIILGDSIKNQKSIYSESKGTIQWFAKTPWVLTHTLFHQVSTVNDYYPEYKIAYKEYEEICNSFFPNETYVDLYPWLTFTTGNKRQVLDAKITKGDLPNELLVSFLRVIKYLGKTDARNDVEIANMFCVSDTPQDIIDKILTLVPYMKNVINTMFDLWKGNIVVCVTENP